MSRENSISRRGFIGTVSGGALSYLFIPGVGRVKAGYLPLDTDDYEGRLCYNENPLGPSPMAQEAMYQAIDISHRYPDWYSSTLESRIGEHHGVDGHNICAGAGATEVIRLVADAFLFPGDEMITATPTYFAMGSEAVANGATVIHVPVDDNYDIDLQGIYDAIGANTKMISLVNPNNPLGRSINKNLMETFIRSLPGNIIVVVDEAYHEYVHSEDYESCIRYVQEGLPVIVIRTFSKTYGLAGARIGYSIASPQNTGMISASQLFGTVSRPSQDAAIAALGDLDHIRNTVALNDQAKDYLESSLTDIELEYIPSETNFLMFDTARNAMPVVFELGNRGFNVRTGWGMPRHIRVSTGLMEEMSGFIEALKDVLSSVAVMGRAVPGIFRLNSVYPNPFNSRCSIRITANGREKVKLTIFDTMGRKVRSLVNGHLKPGTHSIIWDGNNYSGKPVASGIYIANLIQGEFSESKRITLVK